MFLENGCFLPKLSWKAIVRGRVKEFSQSQIVQRAASSITFTRFLTIHCSDKPYIMWEISVKYPKYAGHFKKAIRMLSMVYSRKWYQGCSLCGELTLSKVEHTILFCPATTEIRNEFWLRLLKRFGLRFYTSFINNTPLRQLDMLFSGCYDLFENESDVFDCLKMFALCLNKYKIALDQGITF